MSISAVLARRVLLMMALLMVLAACAQGYGPLPLTKTFDKSPTGFQFDYPDEWDFIIPSQGILMAGPKETLEGAQAGPLFTVLRGLPMSITGSVSGALNMYLERGALTEPDKWRITAEEIDTVVNGRPARLVELQGTDSPELPLTHTRVFALAADNSFVYLIVINVPINLRDRFEPTLNAMLDTVDLLE